MHVSFVSSFIASVSFLLPPLIVFVSFFIASVYYVCVLCVAGKPGIRG